MFPGWPEVMGIQAAVLRNRRAEVYHEKPTGINKSGGEAYRRVDFYLGVNTHVVTQPDFNDTCIGPYKNFEKCGRRCHLRGMGINVARSSPIRPHTSPRPAYCRDASIWCIARSQVQRAEC